MARTKPGTKVEKFVWFLNSYIDEVSAASPGRHAPTHRKIFYFTVIEALAKARYPRRTPARAFSCFVVNYCGWEEGDRISLPHLVAALERTAAEDFFEELREYAYRTFSRWSKVSRRRLDVDPEKSEIQRRWPKSPSSDILSIPELDLDWRQLQHRRLLYAYRSKLSHESREATWSFEEPDDRQPYYQFVKDRAEPHGGLWELVYPAGFLAHLCRTGLADLEMWLLAEGKNPYDQFQFGSFLIDKLNDPEVTVHHPFVSLES